MNNAEIKAALTGLISTTWITTPIAYPNWNYKPTGVEFIRLTIKSNAPTEYVELGETGTGLRYGVLIIDIFTPLKAGSMRGLVLADALEALCRRKYLSDNLTTHEPTTDEIGPERVKGSPNYYHTKVTVPWDAPTGC